MIECISVDRRVLSPWVIFKGKKQQHNWFDNFSEGHICMSDRGWTDDELCVEWLKYCFELETAETQKGKYRMLLFDGHGSHITQEVRLFCEEKKIILLCLPNHSTHILQPLDISIFSPFTTAYRAGVKKRTKWGAGGKVNKILFLEVLQQAQNEAINSKNIQSSWAKTGLFPFDLKVVIQALLSVQLAKSKAILQAPKPTQSLSELPSQISNRLHTRGEPIKPVAKTPENLVVATFAAKTP